MLAALSKQNKQCIMISINHLVIFVGVALSSFVASVSNNAETVPPLSIQPPYLRLGKT